MSLRISSLLLLFLATLSFVRPASASSLSVVYRFNQNSGSGDNAASSISGPGILPNGGGGTSCTWCFAGQFENAGTKLNPFISYLDFSPIFGTFQGITGINPNSNFGTGSTVLNAESFMFPMHVDGSMFTITVPAAMGVIHIWNGTISQEFHVTPGKLSLTFFFGGGQYSFSNG